MLYNSTSLNIELTVAEKVFGLHRNLTVPIENVTGAKVLDKTFGRTLGLRLPGTGIPGLILAGRFVRAGEVAWVSWTRGDQVLQIDLTAHRLTRIVIGVADAQAAAQLINSKN